MSTRNRVVFNAARSKTATCTCSACMNVGNVLKIRFPDTHFSSGVLETTYGDIWLCESCEAKLKAAILAADQK